MKTKDERSNYHRSASTESVVLRGKIIITFDYNLLHMPVDFESYQPNDLPDEETNGRQILEFLADHPGKGYRPGELAGELDMPRGSVGTTLRRLEERGLVRHKGEYWAIDPNGYDAASARSIGLAAVAEQFRGDHYDENADWDAELPDLDDREQSGDGE